MNDVYQWAHGIDDSRPEQILAAHPAAAEGWLGPIREIRTPGRTADSIRMTVTRALSWYADPAVAAATSPGPDEGFDVAEFVSGANTLYLIGTGREEASIAPLFRAFAEYVHAGAAFAGSLQPHQQARPADADGHGRGNPDLPRPAAAVDGRQRRQRHPDRRGLPRPGPARSPLGQSRSTSHLGHRRHQGHPRRRQRPRHPRPPLPPVRRDRAAHPQPHPDRRRTPRSHPPLPARPGPATRTAPDPARMARPGPAHQPVPRHRPAPDGLATPRLPPRPANRPGTTTVSTDIRHGPPPAAVARPGHRGRNGHRTTGLGRARSHAG